MRWWPLIGEAEQKPGSAWPRPAICHAGHGEYRIRNMMSVKMLGDCGAVFVCVCVCVCLNELNGLDSTCYIYSHFSLTHSMTHTHTHTHTHKSVCIRYPMYYLNVTQNIYHFVCFHAVCISRRGDIYLTVVLPSLCFFVIASHSLKEHYVILNGSEIIIY